MKSGRLPSGLATFLVAVALTAALVSMLYAKAAEAEGSMVIGPLDIGPDPIRLGSGAYLQYTLSQGAYITIDVYESSNLGETGHKVQTILDNVYRYAGANFQAWNGKNVNNELVGDGYYKFVITAKGKDGITLGSREKIVLAARPPKIAEVTGVTGPFNPLDGERMMINYTLTDKAKITISILKNYLPVKTLISEEEKDAGTYSTTWDGRLDDGTVAADGTYTCRIYAENPTVPAFNTTFKINVNVEKEIPFIKDFTIYPNPFHLNKSRQLTARYILSEDAQVSVAVYQGGTLVRTIINKQQKRAGYNSVSWDGKDTAGNYVAEGTYIMVIKATDSYGKTREGRGIFDFYPCLAVSASIPEPEAEQVPVDTKISVVFNDLVRKGSSFDNIIFTVEDRKLQFTTQLTGDTLTIIPSVKLAYGTKYTVTVPEGAVVDTAGKPLLQSYSLSFVTEGVPREGAVTEKVDLSDAVTSSFSIINDRFTVNAQVDEKVALKIIEGYSNVRVALIPVVVEADSVNVYFKGGLLNKLSGKGALVEVRTTRGAIVLSAPDIEQSIGRYLDGQNGELEVKITVENAEAGDVNLIGRLTNKDKLKMLSYPIEFKIEASAGDKRITVGNLNRYASLIIYLSQTVNNRYVGGVSIYNNALLPVPSRFRVDGGRSAAVIKSRYTGIYTAVENIPRFKDLQNHWAENDINDLAAKLIVKGIKPNTYAPNNKVTRAQFTTMLVKALGLKPEDTWSYFKDIKGAAWYSGPVNAAVNAGLINGYADGTFRPDRYIRREEAAAIMVRALKFAGVSTADIDSEKILARFKDKSEISPWAKVFVALAARNGIIAGYINGYFAPGNYITRAESAIMINKLLGTGFI
ncbi:S-layer protein [Thermincola ferriacetica]|uniref:S-layer protein n=1 Tax=Thermincola ferriacetica TaxID=281456 RepID=A0A0L6W4T1_9FIRM|nr:S-layer homology domain-containing protein [Thermincola ferriacetica]KNZ70535.1 S-layer protein [Thermincola ferriacetica]